jgi:hypothetical protein
VFVPSELRLCLVACVLICLSGAASGQGALATNCATGGGHSLFLAPDGSLWGMGRNYEGELGDGTNAGSYSPERIESAGVVAVACGLEHSLLLKSDGSLWGMGFNGDGELGDGSNNYTNRPEQIVPGSVVEIAAGEAHSLFRTSDGSLWVMGANTYLVSTGTLDTILVHPREVFRIAVICASAAIVLMHNHPSGDPSPSEADIKVTRDLIRAGQLMKIEVLDHIIVGQVSSENSKGYASLRELGYFL